MADAALSGRTVLVAEDEWMIAADLKRGLVRAGAVVVGPVPSLEKAVAHIESVRNLDAAILDINLQGDPAYPAADLLRARAVPFLFATGYDREVIPVRFVDVTLCEKPLSFDRIERALRELLAAP
jgi:DNA-binding response OmpR family regulator